MEKGAAVRFGIYDILYRYRYVSIPFSTAPFLKFFAPLFIKSFSYVRYDTGMLSTLYQRWYQTLTGINEARTEIPVWFGDRVRKIPKVWWIGWFGHHDTGVCQRSGNDGLLELFEFFSIKLMAFFYLCSHTLVDYILQLRQLSLHSKHIWWYQIWSWHFLGTITRRIQVLMRQVTKIWKALDKKSLILYLLCVVPTCMHCLNPREFPEAGKKQQSCDTKWI